MKWPIPALLLSLTLFLLAAGIDRARGGSLAAPATEESSARASRNPAAVALRLLVLKHLYAWSFADCEREVRGSLIYRAFCGLECERVPDEKTLIRLAQALGPEVWKQIQQRLVEVAQRRKVVWGRKLRVDTAVVETNIHHPTDSSLLGDGVRVISRTLRKIRQKLGALRFRDRTRSVGRRVLEITHQPQAPTPPSLRRSTNSGRRNVVCVAWPSPGADACRRSGGLTSSKGGFGGRCAGGRAAKGGLAPSSDGTGWPAAVITA